MTISTQQDFIKWEGASRDAIDVKRIYIDICDGLVAGIFLSQLLYYFLPIKGDDGVTRDNFRLVPLGGYLWLPINREEWWKECRISIKQYDRVIKICEDKWNIIVTRNTLHGNKKKPLIRIDWPEFLKLFNAQLVPCAHSATSGICEKEGEVNKDVSSLLTSPSASIETKGNNQSGRNDPIGRDQAALSVGTNGPEHKVKEIFKEASKEDFKEQHHHQVQAPESPDGADAGDGKHSKESKGTPRVAKATTGRKRRTRDLLPSFESLEGERREVAIALTKKGVGRAIAIELAGKDELTPALLNQQIEWLPFAIKDEENDGLTVENPPGLLFTRIINFAGEPKSCQPRDEETKGAPAAPAASPISNSDEAKIHEAKDFLKTLNEAQRQALKAKVRHIFSERYSGHFLDSATMVTWCLDFAQKPEIREWLKTIQEDTDENISAASNDNSKAVAPDEKNWRPTDKSHKARLESEATKLVFDIQDQLLAIEKIDEAIADLEGFDENERAYIRDEATSQLGQTG